jgi:hypothetical protein
MAQAGERRLDGLMQLPGGLNWSGQWQCPYAACAADHVGPAPIGDDAVQALRWEVCGERAKRGALGPVCLGVEKMLLGRGAPATLADGASTGAIAELQQWTRGSMTVIGGRRWSVVGQRRGVSGNHAAGHPRPEQGRCAGEIWGRWHPNTWA